MLFSRYVTVCYAWLATYFCGKCVMQQQRNEVTEFSIRFYLFFFFPCTRSITFHIFLPTRREQLTRFLSTSSGTFLVELHSALAALCEKITGALVVCRAALIVLVETCERSTSMPNLFNSLTTACKIMMKRVRVMRLSYINK